ncbi:MAG: alkaline phosphatase family protein [Acidimicrobiia bacterium]
MTPPSPPEPTRAQYGGACVASVVPAILRGEQPAWLPEAVHAARVVVLLVLDGLGWDALHSHPVHMPHLSAMAGGPITTVVPSTTAAALTSITTGLPPSVHGVIGYRVAIDGDVLNVLGYQLAKSKRAPDPFTVQRHAPFLGRPAVVVSGAGFRDSGFTKVHMRDARYVGYRAESTLVEHLRLIARGDDKFVYAYYPGIDEVAHAYGLHDGFYAAELHAADRLVGDVLAALPEDAALVVTADHGQSHVGPDGWRPLGRVADYVAFGSGDARFRYLHARRGGGAELVEAARDEFGAEAWVFSRDELLDGGWLGPDPSPATRRRVGDVVLAAHGGVAFVDPAMPRESHLVSAHGSLTAAEMLVPLVAARGGA